LIDTLIDKRNLTSLPFLVS